MPHEPKVGELPALTDAQKNRYRQMANAYEAHTPLDFMTIMREGIAAEREARKDEARDAARWREQQTHRQALYGPTHWKRYVEFIDRRIELHAAALQAEHGAAARDGEAR